MENDIKPKNAPSFVMQSDVNSFRGDVVLDSFY